MTPYSYLYILFQFNSICLFSHCNFVIPDKMVIFHAIRFSGNWLNKMKCKYIHTYYAGPQPFEFAYCCYCRYWFSNGREEGDKTERVRNVMPLDFITVFHSWDLTPLRSSTLKHTHEPQYMNNNPIVTTLDHSMLLLFGCELWHHSPTTLCFPSSPPPPNHHLPSVYK